MKKIIIIVSIITVLVVAGLITLYFYWAEGNLNINEADTNSTGENTNTSISDNLNTNTSTETNENVNASVQSDKEKIEELARTFSERYASYSNKNDFEHLTNLLDWMTSTLQSKTEEYIETERAKLTGEEDYFAVSSKVFSIQVSTVNEGGTSATVSLERTERNEVATTDTYYQNIVLQFKKINGLWKVNSVSWQDKTTL